MAFPSVMVAADIDAAYPTIAPAVVASAQTIYPVGTWATFGTFTPLRPGTKRIRTSGHTVDGRGSAEYRLSADQSSAAQAWRKKSANNEWYELVPDIFGNTPLQFGAVGDFNMEAPTGGTDDSQAVLDWNNWNYSRGSFIAYPARLDRFYVVSANNFLASPTINAATMRGMKYVGDSIYACGFVFRPPAGGSITDYYVLDGLDPAGGKSQPVKPLFLEMENFRFIMDPVNLTTQLIHAFRQSGWANENPQQGWTLRHLWFSFSASKLANNGDVWQMVGTANCSENSAYSCRSQFHRSVSVCSNAQAVNHTFVDCHWELGTGNVYDYVRGGALTHTGGSIILDNFANRTPWYPGLVVTAGQAVNHDGLRYTADAAGTLGGAGSAMTASITRGVMNVTVAPGVTLAAGMILTGAAIANNDPRINPYTRIVRAISGTGGTGTYLVSGTMTAVSGTINAFTPPTHTSGSVSDGGVSLTYVADDSIYLLSVGGDGTGQINDFTILGVRVEMRTNCAKILKSVGANVGSRVKIMCNSASVVGGYRTTFLLGDNGIKVDISGSGWNRIGTYDEPLTIAFQAASNGPILSGAAPTVSIGAGAQVSKDIHDLITWGNANSAGVVKLDDTVTANLYFGLTVNSDKYAQPDMLLAATLVNPLGSGIGPKGSNPPRRSVIFRMNFYALPSTGGTANPAGLMSRFTPPPGSIYRGFRAFKTTGGGNGQSITLQAQNDETGAVITTATAITSVSTGFDVTATPTPAYAVPYATRTIRIADIGTGGDAGLVGPSYGKCFIDHYLDLP